MSLLPRDTIKVIAESVGLSNLTDELASALAPDVEYRIRDIAQEAIKFMRHSKRSKLSCQDINDALRLRNCEILYGYTPKAPLQFQKAGKDLYYVEDKELEFNEILTSPLPKCPRETMISAHWLAVEGVQPAIPQNPPLDDEQSESQKKRKTTTATTTTSTSKDDKSTNKVKVKPLVKHVLSQELQLYYEKITQAIKGTDNDLAEAALHSLNNDPGIHLLVPYFVQFVSDEVTHNLTNLHYLFLLMKLLRSLLESPHLRVEPYLHQMMPSLLTCLIGKKLCEENTQDHWSLRDFVSDSVSLICKKYGEMYKTLQPRIAKTLVQAITDNSKPLTTQYGAIIGITSLGPELIELLLLPNFTSFHKKLESELETTDEVKKLEARKCFTALLASARVYVSHLSPSFVDHMNNFGKADLMELETDDKESKQKDKHAQYYKLLYDIFGESILPFTYAQKELLADTSI